MKNTTLVELIHQMEQSISMFNQLLTLEQCEHLSEPDIVEQILVRKRLLNVMVGNLYPAIVADEIQKLKKMRLLKLHERFAQPPLDI